MLKRAEPVELLLTLPRKLRPLPKGGKSAENKVPS